MKNRFILIVCSIVCLCWFSAASVASASIDTLISYAITSDNVIEGFSLSDSYGKTLSTFDLTDEDDDWRTAIVGSQSVMLEQGQQYFLKWTVTNTPKTGQDDPYANNPMAFVGQFSLNGFDYYLSSGSDMWAVDGHAPTVFGSLADTSRWSAGIDTLVNDIGGAAMWLGLGDADKFGSGFSRMTVTASFVAPVPIPGAALLLGSAMMGLVGLRRTRMI